MVTDDCIEMIRRWYPFLKKQERVEFINETASYIQGLIDMAGLACIIRSEMEIELKDELKNIVSNRLLELREVVNSV